MIEGLSVLTMQWHVISMDGYLFFALFVGDGECFCAARRGSASWLGVGGEEGPEKQQVKTRGRELAEHI